MNEVRYFWTAIMLLTRLPAPRNLKGFQENWLARSALYFPVVGLLVGLFAAAVYWLASFLWSGPVPALLALIAAALVTGGLHEDGWVDVFDALAASTANRDPKRMLEVMKDSRIGAIGGLALVLLLLGKLSALGTLREAPVALVAAHTLSRWSHLPLLWKLPHARPEGGLASPLARRVGGARVAVGTILTVLITAAALGESAIPALAVALVITVASAFFFRRRLGGITGDCLGATNQLVELCVLLTLATRWPAAP